VGGWFSLARARGPEGSSKGRASQHGCASRPPAGTRPVFASVYCRRTHCRVATVPSQLAGSPALPSCRDRPHRTPGGLSPQAWLEHGQDPEHNSDHSCHALPLADASSQQFDAPQNVTLTALRRRVPWKQSNGRRHGAVTGRRCYAGTNTVR